MRRPAFTLERLRQTDAEYLVCESVKPGPDGSIKLLDRLASAISYNKRGHGLVRSHLTEWQSWYADVSETLDKQPEWARFLPNSDLFNNAIEYDGLKGIDWSWLSLGGVMMKAPSLGLKKLYRTRLYFSLESANT